MHKCNLTEIWYISAHNEEGIYRHFVQVTCIITIIIIHLKKNFKTLKKIMEGSKGSSHH